MILLYIVHGVSSASISCTSHRLKHVYTFFGRIEASVCKLFEVGTVSYCMFCKEQHIATVLDQLSNI